MTSLSGVELRGKTVRVRKDVLNEKYSEGDRLFQCTSGFGCNPWGMGTKIFGSWVADGKEDWIRRSDIEEVVDEP